MNLADRLGVTFGFREALAVGLAVALIAALVVTPRTMRKLLGARIVGRDINKPGRPEVPEMGGLAIFLAFSMGAFVTIGLGGLSAREHSLVLASLVVAAGALVTGVLDDLVELRQRFKAFIPFAFAVPLSLFVPDWTIDLPGLGIVDFGPAYPFVLVPLAVACASNGFNMLEGFNGLGAGLGIILAAGLSLLAIMKGNYTGLALLFPLVGALGGFLWYNAYPARVFPGDTMTLVVGAVLGAAAILSKVEFWGALLFVPHIVEFFLKASGGFKAESFASRVHPDGTLHYEGRIQSLTHPLMRRRGVSEAQLVTRMWILEAVYVALVLTGYHLTERAPPF